MIRRLGHLLILILLLPLALQAQAWEGAVSVAQDALHASPSKAAFLDVRHKGWGGWVGALQRPGGGSLGAGAVDYEFSYHAFKFGIGGAYVTGTTEVNGSRWLFSLTGRFMFHPRGAILFRHLSCGASVFGLDCEPNRGFNLVGVSFLFGKGQGH